MYTLLYWKDNIPKYRKVLSSIISQLSSVSCFLNDSEGLKTPSEELMQHVKGYKVFNLHFYLCQHSLSKIKSQ